MSLYRVGKFLLSWKFFTVIIVFLLGQIAILYSEKNHLQDILTRHHEKFGFGDAFPELSLIDLSGRVVDANFLENRILALFVPSCHDCILNGKYWEEMERQVGPGAVVFVSLDRNPRNTLRFKDRTGLTSPDFYLPGENALVLLESKIHSVPTTLVLRDLRIAAIHEGIIDFERFTLLTSIAAAQQFSQTLGQRRKP